MASPHPSPLPTAPKRLRRDSFDHDADIGIIGHGATIDDAFVAAAEAMFGVMVDLDRVRPVEAVPVSFEERDLELALVRWLNALIGEASARRLAFGRFTLEHRNGEWRGEARGEPWRPELDRGVEVKGATLTMLSVSQDETGWDARCVVDV